MAPDQSTEEGLISEVRRYLAWKSVVEETDALNLDANQQRQAKESLRKSDETVSLRINETYCWLLVPVQEGTNPVEWEISRISGGSESHILKASKSMINNEQLITKWAPALLRMQLDNLLWKEQDYIQVKQLWNYLSSYCYLPRLRDENVLLAAIREGLTSTEYFGYAQGVSEDNHFELSIGKSEVAVEKSGYLVKPDIARMHLEEMAGKDTGSSETVNNGGGGYFIPPGGADREEVEEPALEKKVRRFYAAVKLDSTRVGRDAGKIAEEVIQHLTSMIGARVEVTLEIRADAADGIPDDVVRTVNENCATLKFSAYEFEEE